METLTMGVNPKALQRMIEDKQRLIEETLFLIERLKESDDNSTEYNYIESLVIKERNELNEMLHK